MRIALKLWCQSKTCRVYSWLSLTWFEEILWSSKSDYLQWRCTELATCSQTTIPLSPQVKCINRKSGQSSILDPLLYIVTEAQWRENCNVRAKESLLPFSTVPSRKSAATRLCHVYILRLSHQFLSAKTSMSFHPAMCLECMLHSVCPIIHTKAAKSLAPVSRWVCLPPPLQHYAPGGNLLRQTSLHVYMWGLPLHFHSFVMQHGFTL